MLFRRTTGEEDAPNPNAIKYTGGGTKERRRYEGEELLDYNEDDSDHMDVDEGAVLAGKMRLQSTNSSVFENDLDPALHPLQSNALGNNSCQLPDEYIRARTARRADFEPKRVPGIGKLNRSVTHCAKQFACGSFDSIPDKRLDEVFKVHSVARRANYSLSFNPEKLTCTVCASEHPVIEQKKPVCIILCDQNFRPHISSASDSENCPAVIRIEDGRLHELLAIFGDIFGRTLSDGSGLPAGSVILLSSLTDLGGGGLRKTRRGSGESDLRDTVESGSDGGGRAGRGGPAGRRRERPSNQRLGEPRRMAGGTAHARRDHPAADTGKDLGFAGAGTDN